MRHTAIAATDTTATDTAATHAPPAVRAKRRYLPAAERERAIVEGAVRFFAEHGFDAQTRELAKTMGITHSAIFRYFPTKDALIERVYEHVYVSRWDPAWAALIRDRSRPLEDRLVQFYLEYSDRIFHRDWVRIFVYAGLRSVDITPRYLSLVREALILGVCGEIRRMQDLPTPEQQPLSGREEEAVWSLHGKVFYLALRSFVYGSLPAADVSQVIRDDVTVFLRGIGPLFVSLSQERRYRRERVD